MSKLAKFENKYISEVCGIRRSFISNARSELKKLHQKCNFGEEVRIRQDRESVEVSMIGNHFKLSLDHDNLNNTVVTLYSKTLDKHYFNGEKFCEIKNVSINELFNPEFIQELISLN